MGSSVFNLNNLKKACRYLKRNGLRQAWFAAGERMRAERKSDYEYVPPDKERLEEQRAAVHSHPWQFSILVPAYETDERHYRAMIESVLSQTYDRWELIIADASPFDGLGRIAAAYGDERIRYTHLDKNRGISDNTNTALALAGGDYVGLLDHDDVLTPDALYETARAIGNGVPLLLYSDEDKGDGELTRFFEPNRKPEFNLDLILSNNYICHFLVLRKDVAARLRLRREYDGAQDYDLVLRAVGLALDEGTAETSICHIPRVLYHWRCHAESTASNPESKSYAYEAGRRAVESFARSRGWRAEAENSAHLGFYRLAYHPDILSARGDVGVVGGRLIGKKNKITGGMYDETGVCPYEGLHREYSGYLNRASMRQDAWAVDVRCMRVRAGLWPIFERTVGLPYRELPGTGRFDWRGAGIPADESKRLSLNFCAEVRKLGYLIVWDPEMEERGIG